MTAKGGYSDPTTGKGAGNSPSDDSAVSADGLRLPMFTETGNDTLSSADFAGCGNAAVAAVANQKSIHNNEAGKEFLYRELERIGLKYTPTYGNFILVHFSQEAKDIFLHAQKKGIITRTVVEYGLPNSLRITIGTPQQNKRLIDVLTDII